jgi:hypothetical protein
LLCTPFANSSSFSCRLDEFFCFSFCARSHKGSLAIARVFLPKTSGCAFKNSRWPSG